MHSIFKYGIAAWIILTGVIYFVESLSNTQRKIPFDVYLPPGKNGGILPPVIMVHGLLNWRKSFMLLAPEIAKNTGRVVYAYDLLNHGENEWTEEMTQKALLSQLDQFMHHSNISKAILYGHSLGGKIVMYFALLKPEKVEKLIVEDMSPKMPAPKAADFLRNGLKLVKLGLTQFSDDDDELTVKRSLMRFIQRTIPVDQMKNQTDFLLEWIPIIKRGEKFEMLANLDLFIKIGDNQAPEMLHPNFVGEFHGDTLFLCGTESIFDACNDELISKHFPHSTLLKFEGGNHYLHFQFFKELKSAVSDFINKTSSEE